MVGKAFELVQRLGVQPLVQQTFQGGTQAHDLWVKMASNACPACASSYVFMSEKCACAASVCPFQALLPGAGACATIVPWAMAQSFSTPSLSTNTSQQHTACVRPACTTLARAISCSPMAGRT